MDKVSAFGKNISASFTPFAARTQQYVKEQLGQAEDKTQLPADYIELEKRVDALKQVHQKMLQVTSQYSSEPYDYPNNIKESFGDLGRTVSEKVHLLSTATSPSEAQAALTAPPSAKPQPKTFSHAIARASLASSQLLQQQPGGTGEDPLATALEKYALASERVGEARLAQDSQIQSRFLAGWSTTLNTNLMFATRARKNVENSRLLLDAAKAKSKNPGWQLPGQKPKRDPHGDEAAEEARVEIEQAEDEFVGQTEEAVGVMKNVLDTPEPLRNLADLIAAQLEYHKKAYEILSELAPVVDGLQVEQEDKYVFLPIPSLQFHKNILSILQFCTQISKLASAAPAVDLSSAPTEDPASEKEKPVNFLDSPSSNGSLSDHPIAPDQFEPRWETSKYEIWSYYAYYIGNNGLTLFNFAPTAFQNLLYQAAGDRTSLFFAGRDRTINSIVLLSDGISFAIQIVVFLFLGSFADFGTWRPNILIGLSLVAWGIGFGWLGVHDYQKWEVATGLYIIGLIAYQTTLTFWTAAFPGLARNTPELRQKAEAYQAGEISRAEYDYADTLKRSELSNMAFYIQSLGEVVILPIIVGIMFGVNVNASVANNNWGLSVLIAFATGVWILLSIPWFLKEKRRAGQVIPPGMNIISIGFWQLYRAFRQIWHLKQSLIYLIGYFLLGDSLNTTVTVIATLQNSIVSYNTLELTYLLIVGILAQAIGIYSFWWAQQRYRLSTKTMFNLVAFSIITLDVWGMIGIWTQKFGFHNKWEVWVYQVYYGLFVCPWYSYSQIMISEVTPRGREFLFFSLFSIIGKTSSFIGPLVSSAIIDASPSGNNSTPFYFLTGLSAVSFLVLVVFVDLERSRKEQEVFLESEEKLKREMGGSGVPGIEGVDVRDDEKV